MTTFAAQWAIWDKAGLAQVTKTANPAPLPGLFPWTFLYFEHALQHAAQLGKLTLLFQHDSLHAFQHPVLLNQFLAQNGDSGQPVENVC